MEFSKAWAKAYFAAKLDEQDIEITELIRFPRGSSRDTWFVSVINDSTNVTRKYVVRCDWPTGAIDGSPMSHEYRMYVCLGNTDVPATRALWWEDDPRWINPGQPFYIRTQVEGHWDIPHFLDPDPCYDELRIEISKEHLRKLAIVHNVDWKAAGFGDIVPCSDDPAQCAHHYVEWIKTQIDANQGAGFHEGYPILLEAVEWLHDHAPIAPRVCLCKGTNGLGEEVFQGRTIVAMSDWEEAHIGDPAADFAFMQNFVPNIERDGKIIWNLDMALQYYRSVSGINVTATSVQYYFVVRLLRLMMTGVFAVASVTREPSPTIRKGWVATEVVNMAKRGLAGAVGILPPVSAERFGELNQAI